MNPIKNPYIRHRFPPEVISHAVWLYHRFTLSYRDIEELLAIRGIHTTYESIRRWCLKFPSHYSKKLRKQQGRLGDLWYLDEVFVSIGEKRQYLWRAVDQDGDTIDVMVQSRRKKRAALREIAPSQIHIKKQYANNRAEVSHERTRQQERQMRRFKSPGQAQRFLSFHGLVNNLYRQQRHLLSAVHYRVLRDQAFTTWKQAVRVD